MYHHWQWLVIICLLCLSICSVASLQSGRLDGLSIRWRCCCNYQRLLTQWLLTSTLTIIYSKEDDTQHGILIIVRLTHRPLPLRSCISSSYTSSMILLFLLIYFFQNFVLPLLTLPPRSYSSSIDTSSMVILFLRSYHFHDTVHSPSIPPPWSCSLSIPPPQSSSSSIDTSHMILLFLHLQFLHNRALPPTTLPPPILLPWRWSSSIYTSFMISLVFQLYFLHDGVFSIYDSSMILLCLQVHLLRDLAPTLSVLPPWPCFLQIYSLHDYVLSPTLSPPCLRKQSNTESHVFPYILTVLILSLISIPCIKACNKPALPRKTTKLTERSAVIRCTCFAHLSTHEATKNITFIFPQPVCMDMWEMVSSPPKRPSEHSYKENM